MTVTLKRFINPSTLEVRTFPMGSRAGHDLWRMGVADVNKTFYSLSRKRFWSEDEARKYGERVLARWAQANEYSRKWGRE